MNRHEGKTVVIGSQSKDASGTPHRGLMLATVGLAAGGSSRMGEPKASLIYRGKTFLRCILDTIHDAAIGHAVVAVSPSDSKILKDIDLTRTSVVYNTADKVAGPIGSIRPAVS